MSENAVRPTSDGADPEDHEDVDINEELDVQLEDDEDD